MSPLHLYRGLTTLAAGALAVSLVSLQIAITRPLPIIEQAAPQQSIDQPIVWRGR